MARPTDPGKKEKIIKSSISIFSQKGYDGALIAEVAEAAGIGKGTIYEYFRSKEDLFFATFEYLMSDFSGQIDTMVKSVTGSASTQLTNMADAIMNAWIAEMDLYGIVLEFWSATAASPARDRYKATFKTEYAGMRRVVASLIDKGVARGEFKKGVHSERVAAALIGSWDALLFQGWFDPDFDPIEASRSHMDIVVAGLQSQPASTGD